MTRKLLEILSLNTENSRLLRKISMIFESERFCMSYFPTDFLRFFSNISSAAYKISKLCGPLVRL